MHAFVYASKCKHQDIQICCSSRLVGMYACTCACMSVHVCVRAYVHVRACVSTYTSTSAFSHVSCSSKTEDKVGNTNGQTEAQHLQP